MDEFMPYSAQTPARRTLMPETPASADRRFILLLGTPRSGTTWLASLLNSHRDVLYSHEPLSRLQGPRLEPLVERMKQAGFLEEDERHTVLQEWCRADPDCRRPPFFNKSFLWSPAWLQMLGWTLVRGTKRGYQAFRWCFTPAPHRAFDLLIKDIDWSKHTPAIVRAMNPILINIIRHPCAVAASQLRGQRLGLMPDADRAKWLREHEDLCTPLGFDAGTIRKMGTCEFIGLEWLVQNVTYLDVARSHPRSMVIVYENLCRDTRGVLRGIFDFLDWGLGPQTEKFIARSTRESRFQILRWLRGKQQYFAVFKNSAKSAESWRTELTELEKQQVLSIASAFPEFKRYWPDGVESEGCVPPKAAAPDAPTGGTTGAISRLSALTLSIPLLLDGGGSVQAAQPVCTGLPIPKQVLLDPKDLLLADAGGTPLPLQSTVLNRWSDGSIRWLLVDSITESSMPAGGRLTLTANPGSKPTYPQVSVAVTEPELAATIQTGVAEFCIDLRQALLTQVRIQGQELVGSPALGLFFADVTGRPVSVHLNQLAVEDHGPVRATIRCQGTSKRPACRFMVRVSFFAGTGHVRVALTVHNPARARHRENLWDLGDAGSVLFRELSLEVAHPGAGARQLKWMVERNSQVNSSNETALEIYQDSSGGERWNSKNHVNRQGLVPCSFRGYRVRAGGNEWVGLRASPRIMVQAIEGTITAAIPEFWQQFPKSLEVNDRVLRLGLFPRQFADVFELQGGEQKTHTVWLDFRAAAEADEFPLEWVHQPARLHALPQWYLDSGGIPLIAPAAEAGDRMDALLAEFKEGPNDFCQRREAIDEYGWRNFGDVHADHELRHYHGPLPVISHYNNQYDMVLGAIVQYLRTGDPRWWELLDPLARHVMDIDIYHTTKDKAAYSGGLFWHTDHYKDAATATHRTYSRANRVAGKGSYGGGPSNEHNYTTGLLYYHFLTGDPVAREAVLGLAEWVIRRDDGRRTILGLVDDGPTGLASCTVGVQYQGPGRGCGNSINALLDAWLLTNRRIYLEKAESLIRRTIHPSDDIGTRDLLNLELRWSYTVHLSVLVRYLLLKQEAGELDYMYAYARAGLLHYAQWMLEHEAPYFDQKEKMEFPTETWAAQDIRKGNVLRLAAGFAGEPLRSNLHRKGNHIAERAWQDLHSFETRTVTRVSALVMAEGVKDVYLRKSPLPSQPRPSQEYTFGQPENFVPQKQRVLARLKSLAGLTSIFLHLANPWRWWKHFRIKYA
jgi:hypothetical protein